MTGIGFLDDVPFVLGSEGPPRWLDRQGALNSLAAQTRGPKPDPNATDKKTISQLERRIARLEDDLKKAHTIIDVQKKLSVLLSNMPEQENL